MHAHIHTTTTLNIDDEILGKTSFLRGVKEKTSLVKLDLQAIIERIFSAKFIFHHHLTLGQASYPGELLGYVHLFLQHKGLHLPGSASHSHR